MVVSKSVDLLGFVPAADVALCLLIALEIIKKNKEKALSFFLMGIGTSLFSSGRKPLLVGSEWQHVCTSSHLRLFLASSSKEFNRFPGVVLCCSV